MSLPKLPDFNDDEFEEEIEIREKVEVKEKIKIKKEVESNKNEEVGQVKGRPRIPKSEYDANGKPFLAVPNLDDVNLTNEIEKYFGREDE